MGTLFTALGAAAALAGTDIIPVHQGGARAVGLTGAQLLTYVGGSYVAKTGAQSMAGPLAIASGTLTASAPALNVTQTWNANAAFTAAKINVTKTLSDGVGLLQDWQLGSVSKANIREDGVLTCVSVVAGAGYVNDLLIASTILLTTDAAAQLALRNGVNAQRMHIYGTADGSPGANYQRMVLSANGTTGVTIAAEGLGTPTANQDITLTPGGTGSVYFPGGAYVANSGVVNAAAFVTTSAGFFGGVVVGWPSSDAAFLRGAASQIDVTNGTANTYRDLKLRNLLNTEYHEMTEMTAPAAGAANTARIFAVDNGSGKTKLMVQFATGAAQQLAIEP